MREGLGIGLLGSTAVRSCDFGRQIRSGEGKGHEVDPPRGSFGKFEQWAGTPISPGGGNRRDLKLSADRDPVERNGPVDAFRFFSGKWA